MNYQQALAFMSKAKNIDNGRPTGQRGTRMIYDTHHASNMPLISLRYHESIIVQWAHDHTLFLNQGWNTLTTMNRLREHLKPLGYTIYSYKGKKYLRRVHPVLGVEFQLSPSFMFSISSEGEVTIKL